MIIKRPYTSKQMGDACEMIVAGELTLAGVPAMKAPDYWPGCDIVAQPIGSGMQRISVKARTFKTGAAFVGYLTEDIFDWLAVVILPSDADQRRRYYIVPRNICDERFSQYKGENTKNIREIQIDKVERVIGEFLDNFTLHVDPTRQSAHGDGTI
jgi:hypothetical protein